MAGGSFIVGRESQPGALSGSLAPLNDLLKEANDYGQ